MSIVCLIRKYISIDKCPVCGHRYYHKDKKSNRVTWYAHDPKNKGVLYQSRFGGTTENMRILLKSGDSKMYTDYTDSERTKVYKDVRGYCW